MFTNWRMNTVLRERARTQDLVTGKLYLQTERWVCEAQVRALTDELISVSQSSCQCLLYVDPCAPPISVKDDGVPGRALYRRTARPVRYCSCDRV